jgi:hypothetical protein
MTASFLEALAKAGYLVGLLPAFEPARNLEPPARWAFIEKASHPKQPISAQFLFLTRNSANGNEEPCLASLIT